MVKSYLITRNEIFNSPFVPLCLFSLKNVKKSYKNLGIFTTDL